MIFERHSKGKIFGGHANVCGDTFFDKDSFAFGEADIWQSRLYDSSRVSGRVRRSVLYNSFVSGEAVNSDLFDSTVHGKVLGAMLDNVHITGEKVIVRNSKLRNCTLTERVTVDNAEIEGLTLTGQMRVTGKWIGNAPRYYHLSNDIADIGVTEAHDGQMFIGCKLKSIEKWRKGKYRFARAAGWTPEMADEIYEAIKEW